MDIGKKLRLVYQEPVASGPLEAVAGGPLEAVAGGPLEAGVVYCRVSTPGQEDGTSLDSQRDRNLASAYSLGISVPPEHVITEVWSGSDPDRPGLATVRCLVDSGVVQHVFVSDTDRLARDPLHAVEFIRFCRDRGVRLHFADGSTVDSILDEALQYLKGFVGHQEREKIAERTMLAKIAVAKGNRLPNGSGRGLYGYDYDKLTHTRSINEEEAAVVRQMFDWALSGVSRHKIGHRLTELGIRTRSGAIWAPRTVGNTLTNEAYTGEQWWGRFKSEKIRGTNKRKFTPRPPEEWIRITGFSPQIIDIATFNAVQSALAAGKRRGRVRDYMYTGFFNCEECGSPVVGATQKGTWPYYRCRGTSGDYRRPRICNVLSYRADRLEPVVWKHICAAVQDPSGIIEDLREASGDGGADLDRRISHLKEQVNKRRAEVATMARQLMKGLIDQQMFETLVAPINRLLARTEEDIALLSEQRKLNEGLDHLEEHIRALFSQYADGLSSLDFEGKQKLMRLLNVRLVGGPSRVMVTGVLDPSIFTIGQTSALPRGCSPRSRWGGTRRDWKRTRSQW
jgi:site-specific DNA recombinase